MTKGMTKPITRILVVVLAKRESTTCISSKAFLNRDLYIDPRNPKSYTGYALSRRSLSVE